jgi:hypothetical protein
MQLQCRIATPFHLLVTDSLPAWIRPGEIQAHWHLPSEREPSESFNLERMRAQVGRPEITPLRLSFHPLGAEPGGRPLGSSGATRILVADPGDAHARR